MDGRQFESIYNDLGNKCRAVLREKLQGKSNREIAESLGIGAEATVRQHLASAYAAFNLQGEGKRAKWSDLQALFFQFKPEVIPSIEAGSNPSWVGRSNELARLQLWRKQHHKIIMLVGEGGVGKTALAERFLRICDYDKRLNDKVALEIKILTSVSTIVGNWLQNEFQESVPIDFYSRLRLLEKKLRELRVIIFIDNLETTLHNGLFLPEHRDYLELFRILNSPEIKGFTLITSRERLKEPQLRDIQIHNLVGLTLEDWQQYFGIAQQPQNFQSLQEMHRVYDGNAYAMRLLYNEIQDNYDRDIQAFWQQNQGELEQLDRFSFLVNHQLNCLNAQAPNAYRLLCRMSACQYREIEWLTDDRVKSLLWDVLPEQQLPVARRLYDCCLVQFHRGNYRMHQAIRSAALSRN